MEMRLGRWSWRGEEAGSRSLSFGLYTRGMDGSFIGTAGAGDESGGVLVDLASVMID